MSRRRRAAPALAPLEERLGYRFRDPHGLDLALTHASLAGARRRSNERLEFLGDRVLGLALARLLIERFPDDPEGALGRRLAHLASREVLAEIARELELGRHLRLSRGEEESGGRDNPTILADALEAVLGAVFLDGGFEPAEALVRRLFAARVEALTAPPRDPKTALQEWAQGHGLPLPRYHLLEREGPPHAPRFRVEVRVQGLPPETAEGGSKRAAERAAAEKLLQRITTAETP